MALQPSFESRDDSGQRIDRQCDHSSHGRLAVVGLGYVGIPTAVAFALSDWDVVGVDTNVQTVEAVAAGNLPFSEHGLDVALAQAVAEQSLSAQRSMPLADVFIIAVPTPLGEDHVADLSYIDAAVDAIIPKVQPGNLVVLESTSPPGTTERISKQIFRRRSDLSTHGQLGDKPVLVAHAPERILPGKILIEMAAIDRVIGGVTEEAGFAAAEVYKTFSSGTIHVTDARTAEISKLAENSFRDVNIAFANELSIICDTHGVDVWNLIQLANRHPRVNILNPGPGVGGHCVAVDPWFLLAANSQEGQLIRTSRMVNEKKKIRTINLIQAALDDAQAKGRKIVFFGLTFKPNVDDLRESPALQIVSSIVNENPDSIVSVVEPNIAELPQELRYLPNVQLVETSESVLVENELLVGLVDHSEFRQFSALLRKSPKFMDFCGLSSRKQSDYLSGTAIGDA